MDTENKKEQLKAIRSKSIVFIKESLKCVVSDFNLKYLSKVYETESGYSLKVNCPTCCNQHFFNGEKGREVFPDPNNISYLNVNVNLNNSVWKLNVYDTQCSDPLHSEYNEKLAKCFNDKMPPTEYFKTLEFVEEIKRTFKFSPDDRFFKEDCQVLVGTGGGKTYQSVLKAVSLSIILDECTIFSTKENSMLHDIEAELKKIIGDGCEPTPLIQELLSGGILSKLGIHKLVSSSNLDKNRIPFYRGFITNHKYFYNIGHKAGVNGKMRKIIDFLNDNDKDCTVIIDEFEDCENKGTLNIELNKWLINDINLNGVPVQRKTANCFNAKAGKKIDHSPFDWATRLNTQSSITDEKGIEHYKIDKHGNICLENELKDCLIQNSSSLPRYDYGRRHEKKFKSDNGGSIEYLVAGKYTTLYPDIEKIKTKEERNNLEELFLNSEGVCLAEYTVRIEDEFINSINEFNEYIRRNDISEEDYKSLKHDIERWTGNQLFNKSLLIKQKNYLELLKRKTIYRLSASKAECDIPVNDDLVYKSATGIDKIIYIWVPCEKKVDAIIYNFHELLNDDPRSENIHPLIFYGIKAGLNKKYSEAKAINDLLRTVFITDNLDSDCVSPQITDKATIEQVIKWITATHINGSQSQGVSYNLCELLILNCTPPIDFMGRLYWNSTIKEYRCRTIEEESLKRKRQASGRIDRTLSSVTGITKICLLVGAGKSDSKTAQIEINDFVDMKKKYPYEVEFYEFSGRDHAKLINWSIDTLDRDNRNLDIEIDDIFDDGRRKGNAKKYDSYEVRQLYETAQIKYLIENPKMSKLSLRVAEKLLNIPMKTIDRCLKKQIESVDKEVMIKYRKWITYGSDLNQDEINSYHGILNGLSDLDVFKISNELKELQGGAIALISILDQYNKKDTIMAANQVSNHS